MFLGIPTHELPVIGAVAAIAIMIIVGATHFVGTYIPAQQQDIGVWCQNFADTILANPSLYGLTSTEAAQIVAQNDDFQAALILATNPATRTAVTVTDKDAQMAATLAMFRVFAIQIKNNFGVSNADKIALGVNIINNTRSPIPPPDSNPIIAVIGATQGVHTIRYADANTPDKRSKPAGAIAMQLFIHIGTAPVTSPEDAVFYASVTRQPFGVNFTSDDNGKVATYFARWITRRGQVGPWSPPVNFGIVA